MNFGNVAGAVAGGAGGKLPIKPLQKQPGAMIEKARGMTVGGSMQRPGKPGMQTKPAIQSIPMKPDAPAAPDFKPVASSLQGGGMPGGYQTPPIFGGQQPGGGLQIMDGGAMVPGGNQTADMVGKPGDQPFQGGYGDSVESAMGNVMTAMPPTGPNMAGGGLNHAASGLPPGMQLPPQLQQAVQNGMDPQTAFDRAMQNRAGFRNQVMAQQQGGASPNQPGSAPPGSPQVRNLSDVYRGGGASGGRFDRAAAQQQDRARFLAGQQGGQPGAPPLGKPMPGVPGSPGGVHAIVPSPGGGGGMPFTGKAYS